MDSFEAIWAISRQNQWTNTFYLAICGGAICLLATSLIRNMVARRFLYVFLMLVCSYLAAELKFKEINEKWIIRHTWVELNDAIMTDEQRMIAVADGANLIFGPFEAIFYALVVFSLCLITIFFVRKKIEKASKGNRKQGSAVSDPY